MDQTKIQSGTNEKHTTGDGGASVVNAASEQEMRDMVEMHRHMQMELQLLADKLVQMKVPGAENIKSAKNEDTGKGDETRKDIRVPDLS